ncbi:MAG TPA: molybdopterin-dependent oxidoreductase [Vicinamibacterales bacterium]|jgi:NADH-quinone oxidoreductase subunit G|nr:molybdopterin-dependent oxidoreductase [Vicinamibacterales bacterium]
MDTVTLTIDGKQVTVAKGKTVLQAAIEAGISVPYYCYHPGLTVDGSCRVCIVKIEKMPKLQTSCSTTCTDGMVVSTRDPETTQARAGVLEFLLVNHPLDCPVCDKGGECPLQDFSYSFGPAASRMDFPRRVFDGEGVKADVDFGPTLMLNRNRCILCTRCVRFMREIGGDAQIGIVDRGNGSEIATFREEGVHSLLSGNLMDVCPVGAITTREYRFKSRPWDNPGVVDTICTRCAKGCNTSAWLKAKPEWARGSRLVRMTPRLNPAVNGYWMCDIGRFEYHWVEGDTRLRRPMLRSGSSLERAAWHDVEPRLRDRIQAAGAAEPDAVRFLVSAHASTEELFVLKTLVKGLLGADGLRSTSVTWSRRDKQQPPDVKFKVPATDAPNVNGARDLGYSVGSGNDGLPDLSPLRTAIEAGRVKALYVIDPGPAGSAGDLSWIAAARQNGRLPLLIVQGVVASDLSAAADIILPGTTSFEKDAIYTNDQGDVQAASRALAPPGEALEDWQILVNVGTALGLSMPYRSSEDIRQAIATAMPGTAYENAHTIGFTRAVSASNWLQASNPSERWKWDFLFQDLPPVKGHNVQMESQAQSFIPLKPVD